MAYERNNYWSKHGTNELDNVQPDVLQGMLEAIHQRRPVKKGGVNKCGPPRTGGGA